MNRKLVQQNTRTALGYAAVAAAAFAGAFVTIAAFVG
jgi:hypothetical protein